MHADTVDALKRLNIRLDDLTPQGLWSSDYHLIGLTHDQLDALAIFHVEAEDVTPAQLIAGGDEARESVGREGAFGGGSGRSVVADRAAPSPGAGVASGGRPLSADRSEGSPASPGDSGREPASSAGAESEVPLAPTGGAADRGSEGKGEPKAAAKAEPASQAAGQPQAVPSQQQQQQASGQKPGKAGGQPVPQAQGRKGQQGQQQGQRYGTTRLRISVAGKYTEATVANGKIVVAGRSFDTPDQAAAELTKSRGDWTFWEYYDSTDGKWRMLTRDWDSVLKSATPGGR